jgi:hypothetical protein
MPFVGSDRFVVTRQYLGYFEATLTVLSCGFLLLFVRSGLDFSDESFYIYFITRHESIAASITPFGYILRPIFEIVGSSIVTLRAFGVLALVFTGLTFGWGLKRYYNDLGQPEVGQGLSVLVALCNLSYYALGILTPGYNLLILCGVQLIATGALIGSIRSHRGFALEFISGALVGFGGFISFFAKPTAAGLCALAITPLCLLWLKQHDFSRSITRLAVALLVCVCLLYLSILAGGGLSEFVTKTTNGLNYLKLGNSPSKLLTKTIVDLYYSAPFIWITMSILFTNILLWRRRATKREFSFEILALSLVVMDAVFLVWNVFHGLSLWEPPFAFIYLPMLSLLAAVFNYRIVVVRTSLASLRWRHVLVPCLLIAFPIVLSFGSAIPIFVQSGIYVSPMLIGFVLLFRIVDREKASDAIEAGIALSVPMLLLWASMTPFHQPNSVYRDDTSVDIMLTGDRLITSSSSANAIKIIQDTGRQNAVMASTPIVDLTGVGPGVTLLLNGRAPFYPWILTSVGDPMPLANSVWSTMTDVERRNAWFIGPFDSSLTESVPAKFFAAHSGDYSLKAVLGLPVRHGVTRRIEIWKPMNSSEPTSGS